MTYPIPKWLQLRYSKLLKEFGKSCFTYTQAKNVLKEVDENIVSVIISNLKKAEWIEVKKNKIDSRKKDYRIVAPDKIFLGFKK